MEWFDKVVLWFKETFSFVDAELLKTTLTEIDYKIVKKCYEWDNMRISNFRRYKKDYLPTDFVKAIIKLYKDKTIIFVGKAKEYENPHRNLYHSIGEQDRPTKKSSLGGLVLRRGDCTTTC